MQNFTPRVTLSGRHLCATTIFQKKHSFLFIVTLLINAAGYAQIRTPDDKIDPAFKYVMTQAAPGARQAPQPFSPVFKTTPTKVLITPGMPAEERYDCIIYTSDTAALRNSGILVNSVLPKFVTAWATLSQIQQLSKLPGVNYIAAPIMDKNANDIAVASSGAALLHDGKLNNTVYKGKGVIVAIFDSGIDWTHLDFRNPDDTTKSRILRIWDQTLTPIAGETSPAGMGYGVEYTQAQISDELDGSPAGYVRERDTDGHGTHVAGTAAGNGAAIPATRKYMGMAPEADIVIIKGGNGSYSTTNIINALTYLKNLSTALGEPIVLNMSLGGQFGAHDGTRDYEIAVDNFTASAPGRAVVIAAGNSNGTFIHNQLTLAGGATTNILFDVPADTLGSATDVLEYRVYASDNSALTATFSAPLGGGSVTATAGTNQSGVVLNNSFNVFVSNQIEAGNGDRYVDVYISKNFLGTTSSIGTWTLTLTNNTTNNPTLDGWLYYKNANYSAADVQGGNNDYLVNSPGNATSAITVASFVARPSWYTYAYPGAFYGITARMDDISTFSSHGPRRDGVLKPEISAIGQHVISAMSYTSAPTTSDIIIPGKYRKDQGTSMATPVLTGSVALLLQANPTADVTRLRAALFSNAGTDALTGTAPNAIWGYGRVDVFKAAGSMFDCSPIDRRTYQYDASNLTTQDNGVTLTTTRVAVRFTPDLTGRLAGAYYHTSTTKTALVMEVRTSNSGIPGTLLGTVNLPDTMVALYTWNYVDLSALDIPVTSGTDYFIIVYRSPSSTANWSMRRENTSLDNRSLVSTNGFTWASPSPNYDYKIRSVVYTNPQLTGNIAMANTAISRNIATTNLFIDSSCQLIAQVTPNGASPVSGTVAANVWIEPGVPTYAGNPFVARHYQVTPAANTTSVTARVTLYFTQAEFTAFNADPNSTLDLPASPTDSAGKANLRITRFEGTSSDGTGLPGTYSQGPTLIIDPADSNIVWNAAASRWEVSFDVTGFSGFIVQTSATALPLLVESFSGYPQGSINILNWKVSCFNSEPVFDIQRSANGIDYTSIGTTTAVNGCNQTFVYKDNMPLPGKNYYRIKISGDDGTSHYTKFILLQTGKTLQTTLYPNVLQKGQGIQVVCAEENGLLKIADATGRLVYSHSLTMGVQSLTLPIPVSGIYFYNIQTWSGSVVTGKLIIQ